MHSAGRSDKHDDAREVVRYATEADLAQFYGGPPPYSSRAVVTELDGKIIGVGGVYRSGSHMFAFSEMKDEMRGRKKAMVKMLRLYRPIVAKYRKVFAIADTDEPTAHGFLTALGFEHIETSEHGEVYVWTS